MLFRSRMGGAPTYVLTDNEKTVTVEHVAGIAVRNPQMAAFARHYGVTVHTCEPADPASKGGSESTVKLAKADLAPKDANRQQAVEAGLKVAWFTLEDLGVLLRRHRADDTVSKAIARVLRADLALVDDIGLLPVALDAAEGLYRLVDAAYEKRSVAVSSNLHPAAFDELMPKTLATATAGRLLHHAHVCQTSGDSVRLSQALAGQGVRPPT